MADAVVVGAGPNGLAAALELARAGVTVEVLEGAPTPGGGCRTEALTLPGYRHDVCSAVHALASASPFFSGVDLAAHGVRLLSPEVAFAHPLDGGRAGAVVASVDDTARSLGADATAYRRLLGPLVERADEILPEVLTVLRRPPRHPVAMARFGAVGVLPMSRLARRFETDEARGLLAGVAAHAVRPVTAPLTGAFGLLLTVVAHTHGWPVVEGGSERLVDALVGSLEAVGGSVATGRWVTDLAELDRPDATILDTSPRTLLELGHDRLPSRYRAALAAYPYGPGLCKVDWALRGPVPWAAEACRRAGTVHVGGTFEEVAAAEAAVADGQHPERPFCIVVQPSVVDPWRAPAGHHTLWGYCHVPNGSDLDVTDAIESQIERFAPGFRDLVEARVTTTNAAAERTNPNYVGGDFSGGPSTVRYTLSRPTMRWNPYRTPAKGLYLCSSYTPPGGGVHGMCGVGAARAVLADLRR
ncbi:MAG TPA: NAD(P)/FAD-dependent oxidoreductase [Acidimicrobiales bacterium]|nr:NAD(P)/FAD-dependent oxidoreductase [Acidimicrobiales bacterium]